MPFTFKLPTTSRLSYQDFVESGSHPSLPLAATTIRGVVRNALKRHKRLPSPSQTPHLSDILGSLSDYIPYLLALDAGLSGRGVANEELSITPRREIAVQWRAVLTAGGPGRESVRVSLSGLHYEILFVISTFASVQCLLARSRIYTLYDATTPTPEQRSIAISNATKHFLEASSIFNYLSYRANQVNLNSTRIPDVAPSTFSALASLALAEATLLAVFKDDPYPAAVVQERNKKDTEWMYKAPEISSVRASLFARICIAAADHASKAMGMLGNSGKVVEALPKYADNLKRTARAKAYRFIGIDAELSGKTGEGIAWLRAAQQELGFAGVGSEDEKKSKIFSKIKKDLAEKREDRKIEKGQEWGYDAGRHEEGRVVDMLFAKWTRMNSLVNVQAIPATDSLLSNLPSGREFHNPQTWSPPSLDISTLTTLRVRLSADAAALKMHDEDDSDDEDINFVAPASAFPGSERSYGSATSYY